MNGWMDKRDDGGDGKQRCLNFPCFVMTLKTSCHLSDFPSFRTLSYGISRCLILSVMRGRCFTRVLGAWTGFWFHIVQSPHDSFHHTSEFYIAECQGFCSSDQESKKTSEGRCHHFFTFLLVNPTIILTLVTQGQWKLCAAHVWIKFSVDFS